MHAVTLESPNPVRFCVKPFQESVKQPNTAEAELVQRLKAGDETTLPERPTFDAYANDARPAADPRSCPHAQGCCYQIPGADLGR
jgi:hypothetical protein